MRANPRPVSICGLWRDARGRTWPDRSGTAPAAKGGGYDEQDPDPAGGRARRQRLDAGAGRRDGSAGHRHARRARRAPGDPKGCSFRRRPQPFGGKIERNAAQSTPFWPATVSPPPGAPNVLLILLDDVGYGTNSAFGGVIPTPNLEALAADGLRYTNMHSTALCSPTRAALHHRAQPSLDGLRGDRRAGDRLSRLRQPDDQGQGDDRADPQRQRLQHRLVGQEPQHPGLPGQPGRAVRPMADRHGLRLLLRLQRRRHLAVAAGAAVPQHHADLSLHRPPRVQPRHRDGRRRDRLDGPGQHARSRPSPGSSTTRRARPMRRTIRPRSGSTRSAPCTCSTRAGTSCATRSSPTRSGWA